MKSLTNETKAQTHLEQFRKTGLSQINYFLSIIASNIAAIIGSDNKAFIDIFLASTMENVALLQGIISLKTQKLFAENTD